MTSSSCETCRGEGATLTCAYCRGPLYCSRKCQALDWVAHACPNAVDMPVGETLFVPYHYEDLLPRSQVEQLDARDPVFQSYSVRSISSDMRIEHRVQGALLERAPEAEQLRRGVAPPAGTNSYEMTLSFNGDKERRIQGAVPQNCIFPANETNTAAKILGGGKIQAEVNATRWNKVKEGGGGERDFYLATSANSYVFWPNVRLVVPLAGEVSVGVGMDKERRTLRGHYDATRAPSLSKVVRANYEAQLSTKRLSPENLRTLRAEDARGNAVVMTLLVGEQNATLVDLEFHAPVRETEAEHVGAETLFDCDPHNTNQLVGLAMGLELISAQDPAHAHLKELASTIGAFARQKMDNPDLAVTPDMASAVTEAVNLLHEEFVEGKFADRFRDFRQRTKSAWVKSRGTSKTLSEARQIKKRKDSSQQEKREALQALYDEQLENARLDQTQNQNTANEYIDRATVVFTEAKQYYNESRPIVLDKRMETLVALQRTAKDNSVYKKALQNLLKGEDGNKKLTTTLKDVGVDDE